MDGLGLCIKKIPEDTPCAGTSSQPDPPLVKTLQVDLCRLCANVPDSPIEIYNAEGITPQLSEIINEYLPVKVSPEDELSLCCCSNCASTILSFHEFALSCVEAQKRLPVAISEEPKPIPIVIPPAEPDQQMATVDDEEGQLMDDDEFNEMNEDDESEEETKLLVPGTSDDTEAMAEWDVASASLNAYSVPAVDKNPKRTRAKKQYGESESVDLYFENMTDEDAVKKQPPESSGSDEFCSDVFLADVEAYGNVKSERPKAAAAAAKKPMRKHRKVDKEMIEKAKVVVDGKVYYNCKTCGKSLHSPYTYIWHMRIHTGERPYVCDLCGKQFRVSQGLVRHLKETHEGIKNYPCDLCGRMFATRRNVEEHRRIHTNERPYVCDLCGKAFKQKASLFVHNRSHTNYFPYRCSYCDQGFRTRPTLLIHVTRHTGEKPYPCDICGRRFRIKYELNRHKLIHSDEKPFKCEHCGTGFRQKRYLRNHMKINHGTVE